MKPVKEKKEKRTFGKELAIYGFIAITLIGFLGYMWGSIAIMTTMFVPALIFKPTSPQSGNDIFNKSTTQKIKDVWTTADKKKKAGIVIGLIALLPFFILGILWLAMMGAMFLVDLFFILPIILIVLWVWFRNPEHQTFSGSSALGHPAILGVALIMILIIVIVGAMNYMELHKYDGLETKDIVVSYTTAKDEYYKDTDNDGIPDIRDPDIDGDNITNELDIDRDGDGFIDNTAPLVNYNNYNETIQKMIYDQYMAIPEENRNYVDPDPPFGEEDFINENGEMRFKNYTIIIKVFDPLADEVFPLQRTVNLVGLKTWNGYITIPAPTFTNRTIVDIDINETTSQNYSDSYKNGTPSIVFSQVELPLGTKDKGTPIPHMKVMLTGLPKKEEFRNPKTNQAVGKPIETDANGVAVIHATAGVYKLRVEGAGYLPFSTDFIVSNNTKSATVLLIPMYVRVPIYFKAFGTFDTETQGKVLWFGGNVKIDGKPAYSLYFGEVRGLTKTEYEVLYQQNAMFGWSGLTDFVINPSFRTNKMLQSMFNSMVNGLNWILSIQYGATTIGFISADVKLDSTYEIGTEDGTKPEYCEQIIVKGNTHITKKNAYIEYVVWPKGELSAINGASLKLTVTGEGYFSKATFKAEHDIILPFLPSNKAKIDTVKIPLKIEMDKTLTPKDYEAFYQA